MPELEAMLQQQPVELDPPYAKFIEVAAHGARIKPGTLRGMAARGEAWAAGATLRKGQRFRKYNLIDVIRLAFQIELAQGISMGPKASKAVLERVFDKHWITRDPSLPDAAFRLAEFKTQALLIVRDETPTGYEARLVEERQYKNLLARKLNPYSTGRAAILVPLGPIVGDVLTRLQVACRRPK